RDFHVTGVQTCALPISMAATAFLEKSPRISSRAKKKPAIGALNTALRPAAAPLASSTRVRAALSPKKRETLEPMVEPADTIGPRSEERRAGKDSRSRAA